MYSIQVLEIIDLLFEFLVLSFRLKVTLNIDTIEGEIWIESAIVKEIEIAVIYADSDEVIAPIHFIVQK